jgi:hypothetical protein
VTQFNNLPALRRRQRAPEAVNARGLHVSKILDVLNATKLDLKERRVMIDIKSLEFPENNGGIFGGELLVFTIVIKRSREDGAALFRSKLLKGADTGLQLHLLGKLGEVPFRFCR